MARPMWITRMVFHSSSHQGGMQGPKGLQWRLSFCVPSTTITTNRVSLGPSNTVQTEALAHFPMSLKCTPRYWTCEEAIVRSSVDVDDHANEMGVTHLTGFSSPSSLPPTFTTKTYITKRVGHVRLEGTIHDGNEPTVNLPKIRLFAESIELKTNTFTVSTDATFPAQ